MSRKARGVAPGASSGEARPDSFPFGPHSERERHKPALGIGPARIPGRRRPAGRPMSEQALPPAPLHARRKRKPTSDTTIEHLIEVVYFFLYDVGRSIDLKKVAALIPAHPDIGIVKRRDTPASLTLPKPLILQIGEEECIDHSGFECFTAQAKIYDEGVITVLIRVKARTPFGELHRLKDRRIETGGRALTIPLYAEEGFRKLYDAIGSAVSEPFPAETCDRETYAAFCLLDCPGDPAVFLERNRDYTAALLIAEESGSELHESQIDATLGKPSSYHRGDLAVFDLDRCLIIDSAADYEDILLIVEHANYQLLELRVLDKLLDVWLDTAEKDIRRAYSGSGRSKRILGSAKLKFATIQALRFDSLFILENLENSSKIIGDYYLGQIYDRLCSIFNVEGWKWSIERRLDALQGVYEMLKGESGERRMVTLEIIFIIVCIIPIVQFMLAENRTASETVRDRPPAVAAPAIPGQAGPGKP